MNATEKMTKARSALVLEDPFFGTLVLRLTPKADPSCETLWTDGAALGFSPDFVDRLSFDELKGSLRHEVLHCALAHHARRGDRDAERWNIAADYATNALLRGRATLPAGALDNPAFDGLAVEDIYSKLPRPYPTQAPNPDPGGSGEVRDPAEGDAAGTTPSPAELARSVAEWQIAVAQAAQAAKNAGKLPADMAREIDRVVNPRLPWREILRRFIDRAARTNYSWLPPNRRHVYAGRYFPSARAERLREIAVAVDTSGSIDAETLARFAAELSAIAAEIGAGLTVIYCDARIQRVETYTREDLPLTLNPAGGGGTDFRPVFEHLASRAEDAPACLIYLTDLWGTFPDFEPDYPVLWAATRDAQDAPWGETLPLN